MHWEELTGDQFPEAVATVAGVCLLPLSCLERHAHHLPLGTDMYIGHELCRRAAAIRLIKRDGETQRLQNEFYASHQHG